MALVGGVGAGLSQAFDCLPGAPRSRVSADRSFQSVQWGVDAGFLKRVRSFGWLFNKASSLISGSPRTDMQWFAVTHKTRTGELASCPLIAPPFPLLIPRASSTASTRFTTPDGSSGLRAKSHALVRATSLYSNWGVMTLGLSSTSPFRSGATWVSTLAGAVDGKM